MNETAMKDSEKLKALGFDMTPKMPSNNWRGQKFILAGPPKSGKTDMLSEAGEAAWFVRCAKEHGHVKTFGVDCTDFYEVEKVVDKLYQAKNAGCFPWETLVIDPALRALDYISESVIDRGREKFKSSEITDLGDIGKGTGYYMYKQALKGFLKRLEGLPCAVFLVFQIHTEERNKPGSKKETYKRDIVNISEKLGGPIREWADHILQVRQTYVGDINVRKVVTQGNMTVEAGTRNKKMPVELKWTSDSKRNYDELRAQFD